jgi:Domain of unknown function (DUF4430)
MLSRILGRRAPRLLFPAGVFMDSPEPPNQKSCAACGTGWRFPVLLTLLLVGVLLARSGRLRNGERAVVNSPPDSADAAATGKTVSLVVDFGVDRVLRFAAVPWHKGMTIEDLLAAVGKLPGSPKIAKQGSGPSALLTRIGEQANEGAGGRNWTYRVNDQLGDRSFAVYQLQPGDRVLWKFGPQE